MIPGKSPRIVGKMGASEQLALVSSETCGSNNCQAVEHAGSGLETCLISGKAASGVFLGFPLSFSGSFQFMLWFIHFTRAVSSATCLSLSVHLPRIAVVIRGLFLTFT